MNKIVPNEIQGVTLHPRAKQRTRILYADLESIGITGISKVESGADRVRLLASYIFNKLDEVSTTENQQNKDDVKEFSDAFRTRNAI